MIWVVEPHADDAFLSMGGIIEAHPDRYGIITVFTTRKRNEDAKRFADAVGVPWKSMNFKESEDRNAPAGTIDQMEVVKHLEQELRQDIFVMPLGVGRHPEHLEVRRMFEKLVSTERCRYYVDQPYATQLKNQADLDDLLKWRKVVTCMRPGARKYRHVALFKDQAKFFYYNKPEDLEWKTFELVVM